MVTLSSSLPLFSALLELGELLDEVVPDGLDELPDLLVLLELLVLGELLDEVRPGPDALELPDLSAPLELLVLGELLDALPLALSVLTELLLLDSSTGSASTVSMGLSEGWLVEAVLDVSTGSASTG